MKILKIGDCRSFLNVMNVMKFEMVIIETLILNGIDHEHDEHVLTSTQCHIYFL